MTVKTRITRSRGYIALLQVEPGKATRESNVLAAMTLYEGTGCWRLVDVRLARHRTPSPYSGSLIAEDFHSSITPASPEDAAFFKSHLREYREDSDGTLRWCTFEGIVRGHPAVNGYTPPRWANFDQAGYFSQAEGLARLKEIQAFWDTYEGDPAKAKIDNPLRQPSESVLRGELYVHKLLAEKGAAPAEPAIDDEYGVGPSL
ncbi:hypothetical protein [Geopseudomonas aromaticivorans]